MAKWWFGEVWCGDVVAPKCSESLSSRQVLGVMMLPQQLRARHQVKMPQRWKVEPVAPDQYLSLTRHSAVEASRVASVTSFEKTSEMLKLLFIN